MTTTQATKATNFAEAVYNALPANGNPKPFGILQQELGIWADDLRNTLFDLQKSGVANILYGSGWHRVVEPTPYDTGERLEPIAWVRNGRAGSHGQREAQADDYGKVDFDDDCGTTLLTVYVTTNEDGLGVTLHVEGMAAEDGEVEVVIA